jgi:hypothetical protein
MKRFTALALSLFALGAAQAATETVTIQTQTPPSARAMAADVKGIYLLADGRQLVVSRAGLHLMAELEQEAPVLLQTRSGSRAQAADGSMTLDFTAAPSGHVFAVTMTTRR